MKKFMKKSVSVLLALIIIVGTMIIAVPPEGIDWAMKAEAAQDRTEHFDKKYTLGSNKIDNLIAVAEKQIGKKGSDLKYTEYWCANFVSDCAQLAGVDDVIPRFASCTIATYAEKEYWKNDNGSGIADRNGVLIKAGGTRHILHQWTYNGKKYPSTGYDPTYKPKRGDIIFFSWDGGYETRDHVGIVTKDFNAGDTYVEFIHGNTGSPKQVKRSTNDYTLKSIDIWGFVTPNYSGSTTSAPTATFDFHGTWATDNRTVSGKEEIHWKQTGYGNCDINVYIDGVHKACLKSGSNGEFSWVLDTTTKDSMGKPALKNGSHTIEAKITSTSGQTATVKRTFKINNQTFQFWGDFAGSSDTFKGEFDIWMLQQNCGSKEQSDVNVYIDGKSADDHIVWIDDYDDNGYYKFKFDTSKYTPGWHTIYANLFSSAVPNDRLWISRTFYIEPHFTFWGAWNGELDTISGSGIEVWMKQYCCGTNDINDLNNYCDVNIFIDGQHKQTLKNDSNNLFRYFLDSTTLSDGEHELKAILRSKSGITLTIIKKFTTKNDFDAPVITDTKVANETSYGYLVTCRVNDEVNEIDSVRFASRPSSADDSKIKWYDAKKDANNGVWYVYIKTSDFDNVTGNYATRIFATDTSGNETSCQVNAYVPEYKTEIINNGNYTITNSNFKKNLTEIEDSTSPSGYYAVFAETKAEDLSALWYFYLNANGYYEIINRESGNYLTITSIGDGSRIICQEFDERKGVQEEQEWIVSRAYDNTLVISPRKDPAYAIDINVTSTSGYNKAFVYHAYNVANQRCTLNEYSLSEWIYSDFYSVDMCVGDTLSLNDYVTVGPDGYAYRPTVVYEIQDSSVITISDGVVTAVGSGTATINVKHLDGSAFGFIDTDGTIKKDACFTINVVDDSVPITGVVLSSDNKTLAVGETSSIFASVLPGNHTRNPLLTWSSSDEAVATVETGRITAVGVGDAIITVSTGEFSFDCAVTVVQPITELTIMCDTAIIDNKYSFSTPVYIYPADTTDAIIWTSSDESVAVVDEYGNVTAVGSGACTIAATSGGITSDFSVEVPMVETTSLVINTGDTALEKGESFLVSKVVYPYNSTDEIIWTSSDESVATVVDGTITAIGAGNCVITVTSGGCSESFNLTVYVPAESITLDKDSLEIKVGESYTFSPVITPVDTTDIVFWYADEPEGEDPVAIIDENGKLTANRPGTTTVVAAIGEKYQLCEVTVSYPETTVKLDVSEAVITPEESLALKVSVEPEEMEDTLVWSSSDERIATVDGNGKITPCALGTAVITATAGDASASCTIEVIPPITLKAMGGSVRIVEPYGLRFGIQLVKDDAYNEYKDVIVSYGTLIIPKKNLGDTALTFEVANVKDVPAVNIYSEDSTQLTYTGVLVGIPKSSFYSDIVGRGYLKYNDIDGNEKVIYTDEIVRSYYQVADSAYKRYGAMTDRDATEQAVYEKLAVLLAEMTDGDNLTTY